jgi:hypothetical protein
MKKKSAPRDFGRLFYWSSFGLLFASGCIWLASRYGLEGRPGLGDWVLETQYWALRIHGAGMLLFLLALGNTAAQAALAWKERGKRKIEFLALLLLALAVLSGWLIDYGPTGDMGDRVAMGHWIVGLLAALALVWPAAPSAAPKRRKR